MFCPQCGKEILEGQAFCQHCGVNLVGPVENAAPVASGRVKTAWEDRDTSGFLKGLLATLQKVLSRPTEFFRGMPVNGGLIDPLLFALIIGMVGLIFDYFWRALLTGAVQDFMPPEMAAASGQPVFQGMGGLGLLSIFLPVLIVVGLFVSSGLLHLFLSMVKGARAGFEATFRVVAYGYSANIFLVIPICGYLIMGVWTLILLIIGLKESHETSAGKAFFAVSFPIVLCCGVFIFAMSVVFMGVLAASFGALMHLNK